MKLGKYAGLVVFFCVVSIPAFSAGAAAAGPQMRAFGQVGWQYNHGADGLKGCESGIGYEAGLAYGIDDQSEVAVAFNASYPSTDNIFFVPDELQLNWFGAEVNYIGYLQGRNGSSPYAGIGLSYVSMEIDYQDKTGIPPILTFSETLSGVGGQLIAGYQAKVGENVSIIGQYKYRYAALDSNRLPLSTPVDGSTSFFSLGVNVGF